MLLALAVACVLVAGAAARACEVREAAAVPIDVSSPNMVVRASVNGTLLPFILDTGSQRTVLALATVQRLGLPRDQWAATTMRGVGGDDQERNARPSSIVLGGVMMRPHALAPYLSVPVARLPFGLIGGGEEVAGLLGADLLSSFDLMIDGPARRLTLYEVRDCEGRFLPWTMPYAAVPTIRPIDNVLLVPVRLDGHLLLAELDSGAAYSTILAPGMAKLGLTEAQLAPDRVMEALGVGPNKVTMRLHRFGTMIVGNQVVPGPSLLVGPARGLRIVDMLLGADFLRSRIVWVSYATSQIFMTGP